MNTRKKPCYNYVKKENGDLAITYEYKGEKIIIVDNIKTGKLDLETNKLEKAFAKRKSFDTMEEYLENEAKKVIRKRDAFKINTNYNSFLKKKGWKLKPTKGGVENIDILDEFGNVLYRGNKTRVEKYIKFKRLPISKQRKIAKKMYRIVASNSKKYNKAKSKKKLLEIGYDVDIPATSGGLGKGNGVCPDISVLGDDMFMIDGKLGNGKYSKIKAEGFRDKDILDALSKLQESNGTIRASVTSDRGPDFDNCWKALGIDPKLGELINSKLKLTWHHIDDLDTDMKSSFQLVIRKIHEETRPHIGSHKQIEVLLDLVN